MSGLTKCPTCNGQVAYGAPACPHCGKKNPAPRPIWQRPFAMLTIAFVAYIAYSCTTALDRAERRETDRQANLTPEQKAAEAKKRAQDNLRDDATAGCQVQLKKFVKDPSSLDIDDNATRVTLGDNKGTVLLQYRAKNSFGAIVPGTVACDFSVQGTSTTITKITGGR